MNFELLWCLIKWESCLSALTSKLVVLPHEGSRWLSERVLWGPRLPENSAASSADCALTAECQALYSCLLSLLCTLLFSLLLSLLSGVLRHLVNVVFATCWGCELRVKLFLFCCCEDCWDTPPPLFRVTKGGLYT
jgi:hypothetical protein